jgi:hypothetical protein
VIALIAGGVGSEIIDAAGTYLGLPVWALLIVMLVGSTYAAWIALQWWDR